MLGTALLRVLVGSVRLVLLRQYLLMPLCKSREAFCEP